MTGSHNINILNQFKIRPPPRPALWSLCVCALMLGSSPPHQHCAQRSPRARSLDPAQYQLAPRWESSARPPASPHPEPAGPLSAEPPPRARLQRGRLASRCRTGPVAALPYGSSDLRRNLESESPASPHDYAMARRVPRRIRRATVGLDAQEEDWRCEHPPFESACVIPYLASAGPQLAVSPTREGLAGLRHPSAVVEPPSENYKRLP